MTKNTREVVQVLRSEGNKVVYRKRSDGGIRITSINGVKFKGAEGNKAAREMTGLKLSSKAQSQRVKIATEREAKYQPIKSEIERLKKVRKTYSELKINPRKSDYNKDIYRKMSRKEALEYTKIHSVKELRKFIEKQEEFINVPDKILKQFKEVQKEWEKHEKLKGKFSLQTTRRILETEGERSLSQKLSSNLRYAQGYAYAENVAVFADMVKDAALKANIYPREQEMKNKNPNYRTVGDAVDELIEFIKENMYKIKESSLQDAIAMLYDLNKIQISQSYIDKIKTVLSRDIG